MKATWLAQDYSQNTSTFIKFQLRHKYSRNWWSSPEYECEYDLDAVFQ